MSIETIILITVSVITGLAIVCIIVIANQTKRLQFLSKWFDFKTVFWENIAGDQKYAQIELAIDKLLKENSDITNVDELIMKIPMYVACDSQEELEYCQTYLKKIFEKGLNKHQEQDTL